MEGNSDGFAKEHASSIVVVLGVVLFIGFGFFIYLQAAPDESSDDISTVEVEDTPTPTVAEPTAVPSVTSADLPRNTVTPEQSGEDEVLEIEVTGENFLFTPNVIRASVGQTVKVSFESTSGLHDFVIDELDVATERLNSGESDVVRFTPTEAGTYSYYCSVGNHRALGMEGTLIVE